MTVIGQCDEDDKGYISWRESRRPCQHKRGRVTAVMTARMGCQSDSAAKTTMMCVTINPDSYPGSSQGTTLKTETTKPRTSMQRNNRGNSVG